jgi:hypothetical protein
MAVNNQYTEPRNKVKDLEPDNHGGCKDGQNFLSFRARPLDWISNRLNAGALAERIDAIFGRCRLCPGGLQNRWSGLHLRLAGEQFAHKT